MEESDLSAREKVVVAGVAIGILGVTAVLYLKWGNSGLDAASVIITGFLSLALVVLYYQQRSIQETQTQLMERKFESDVRRAGPVAAGQNEVYIKLRNDGPGAVGFVRLKWEIEDNDGSIVSGPTHVQLNSVDGDSSRLSPLSDPKMFKAHIGFLPEGEYGTSIDSNEPRTHIYDTRQPFSRILEEVAAEVRDQCLLRLTVEIIDERGELDDESANQLTIEQPIRVPRYLSAAVEDGNAQDVPTPSLTESLYESPQEIHPIENISQYQYLIDDEIESEMDDQH